MKKVAITLSINILGHILKCFVFFRLEKSSGLVPVWLDLGRMVVESPQFGLMRRRRNASPAKIIQGKTGG